MAPTVCVELQATLLSSELAGFKIYMHWNFFFFLREVNFIFSIVSAECGVLTSDEATELSLFHHCVKI